MSLTNDLAVLGGTAATLNSSSFLRNRIINGAMMIDQRNAGAAVNAPVSGSSYTTVDRWRVSNSTASAKFSTQRQVIANIPGAGFNLYTLNVTSLATTSLAAGDYYGINQFIEANNIGDLAWGTASAKTVTLSFYVYCSLTGTFGGAIRTGDGSNYSYPFSYTISAANTWTSISITIPGPTSGTWSTTGTGVGIDVWFSLGSGSSFRGTAGSWAAANYIAPTGETSVVGTNAATWYITGVQLEVGSVATPFERRQYGQELALCQRYYYRLKAATSYANAGVGRAYSTTNCQAFVAMPVSMRGAPTGSYSALSDWNDSGGGTPSVIDPVSQYSGDYRQMTVNMTGTYASGQAIALNANNTTNAWMAWSAEL